jgi:hypothetical protein
MDIQREEISRQLPPGPSKINDFGLKYCILKENGKNDITGKS